MTESKELKEVEKLFSRPIPLIERRPEGRAEFQLVKADNGLIVIYDDQPYNTSKRFVTVVLDLQNKDCLLIHRFDIKQILSIVQTYSEPTKAMDALREAIPLAFTPEYIKRHQKDLKEYQQRWGE